jgi:hypothetical protein
MSADGTWNTTINTPMGAQQGTLTIATSGDTFSGTMAGRMGEMPVSGTVEDGRLKWKTDISQPMPMTLEFDVGVDGDNLSGNVKLGAFGNAPITGTRA